MSGVEGRPSGPAPDDLFAAGGACGRIMASIDWAATPLGPTASWPLGLRFAVRTVLVSRLPMVLTWGPEFTQLYNDAYAPLIGAAHPAIGQDIRVTFAAGWDALGPPIERAMRTLEPSWFPALQLLIERAGYREESYFTVTHAPAFDDDGTVGGMHAIGSEVTGEVIGARRQRLLHELSAAGRHVGDVAQTVQAMCGKVGASPLDVPFAAVYLAAPDEPRLRLVATTGCDAAVLPPVTTPDAAGLVSGIGRLGLTGGPWGDPVTEAVALPLAAGGSAQPLGVLVVGTSPNLALDEEYRSFHELMAAQFAGAIATSRAFEIERRRAESLAALDRAKTTFFSDVSHELRTPLTLLMAPLRDVLEDSGDALGEDGRERLRMALRNGERLQRLVNDLLEVASIEAGRARPVRVATDVPAFTAELAGLFRAAVERAGMELAVVCPPLRRPVFVDPRMWEKVVVNLLANAVKYTFVGRIEVLLEERADGFSLTVADTGIGIPAEELPLLFQRFHRVSGAAARTREGTGIGLALVHDLVGLHGGSVAVASEPGRGSRFTVTMPPGVADDPGAGATEPSAAARGEAEGWERTGSRPARDTAAPAGEVLVVDDNPDMRAYLTRVLSPRWSVRTTADGIEALAAVAERRPDVVVTDVMMPRMDGFELLRALRSDPSTGDVPVLVLTARAGQEASVEGLHAGADDYLAKPFQAAELLARVRSVAARSAGRGGPPPGIPSAQPASADLAPAEPPTVDVQPMPAAGAPVVSSARPEHAATSWRLEAAAESVPVLRRRLGPLLAAAGLDDDRRYDVLLAACEAFTNAVEHAQDPIAPHVDVTVAVTEAAVEIAVRDYGQWRERVASLDRGRGSTLMSAVGDVTATPSPEGTTVVLRAAR